jgi:hypothetical protein
MLRRLVLRIALLLLAACAAAAGALLLPPRGTAVTRQQPYRQFWGHTGILRELAFAPDGRLLATSSVDGTVKLWTRRRTWCAC